MKISEIALHFSGQELDGEQSERLQAIRNACATICIVVSQSLPEGRHREAAIQGIEQTYHASRAAIESERHIGKPTAKDDRLAILKACDGLPSATKDRLAALLGLVVVTKK